MELTWYLLGGSLVCFCGESFVCVLQAYRLIQREAMFHECLAGFAISQGTRLLS